MSVHPSSDLVLDVVKAADPVKSLAAARQISNLNSTNQKSEATFPVILGGIEPSHVKLQSKTAAETALPLEKSPSQNMKPKVFKELEQLVLRNLVETMLPKQSESNFGQGTAGDMWKSMMADILAKDLGQAVDLGLSKAAFLRPAYASSFNAEEARAISEAKKLVSGREL